MDCMKAAKNRLSMPIAVLLFVPGILGLCFQMTTDDDMKLVNNHQYNNIHIIISVLPVMLQKQTLALTSKYKQNQGYDR